MKNKKIVIALFVLAVVLLGGFTVGVLQGITPEENTCNVVIKYYTVDSYGEQTLYKTYSEEYVEGEQINIKSPAIEGYKPNKEKVSAIVKSDLNVTVLYECVHFIPDESLDKVISYPTSTTVGILERTCSLCGSTYIEDFTSLTRTFTFGDESLKSLKLGSSINGYSFVNDGQVLVCLDSALPELDIIFDGIENFSGNVGLGYASTASISYDKEAWDNAKIVYRHTMSEPVPEDVDFLFIFGNRNRAILGFDPLSECFMTDFLADDSCPLFSAPLTITLTYDYTK